jgi:hypothetical protein
MHRMHKKNSNGILIENRFIDLTKVVLSDVQKAYYEFSMSFIYIKHHLSELVKIGFMDTRDAENDFAWPSDTFKHRFIDFTKVLFSQVQKSDYVLPGPFVY